MTANEDNVRSSTGAVQFGFIVQSCVPLQGIIINLVFLFVTLSVSVTEPVGRHEAEICENRIKHEVEVLLSLLCASLR